MVRWDEAAPLHASSELYDLDGFRAGRNDIRPFEIDELGPISGLELLHLQCDLGTDTLSWARLGARVVGLARSCSSWCRESSPGCEPLRPQEDLRSSAGRGWRAGASEAHQEHRLVPTWSPPCRGHAWHPRLGDPPVEPDELCQAPRAARASLCVVERQVDHDPPRIGTGMIHRSHAGPMSGNPK